jgi:chromatin structure-remodeling complex subunit RSC1/2
MATNSSQAARSPVSTQHQPQSSYGQQFAQSRPSASPAPALLHNNSYGSHNSSHQTPVPLTPQATSHSTYNSHYSSNAALPTTNLAHSNQTPNPLTPYDGYRSGTSATPHRTSIPLPSASSANAYNPPRPVEVYHLSDSANATIPYDIRAQFHRDEHDRVLFFTAPPLDVSPIPESAKTLGHSVRYLAAKVRERVASQNEDASPQSDETQGHETGLKRRIEDVDERCDGIKRLKGRALEVLGAQINEGTQKVYKEMYGSEWEAVLRAEEERLRVMQTAESAKRKQIENNERQRRERRRIRLGAEGVMVRDD